MLVALTVYLDALVQKKFSGRRWALPAKVYGRPLELYAGARLSKEDLLRELQSLGYRWGPGVARAGDYSTLGDHVDLHSRSFRSLLGGEPSQAVRVRFQGAGVAALNAPDGSPLQGVRLEPMLMGSIYPNLPEDRILVRLEQAPPHFVETLLTVEDQAFLRHHGLSAKSIVRALWVNASAHSVVQGGSTLTQQLVKNFYLTNQRSLLRKAAEAEMALLLELHYDKREILQAYLNEVFLGQDGSTAVHGFGLASQYLFGQPFSELQLHQVALLVGLVKGPSYYNPRSHPERALARRDLILDMLAEHGIVTAEEAAEAKSRGLEVTPRGSTVDGAFPAFLTLVKRQLREEYPEQELAEGGLQVFTGFDPIKQWKAEAAVADTFAHSAGMAGASETEVAMLAVNPANGEIQALVGGRQAGYAGFNRALDAVRPIGSLVKPAIYLTALLQPQRYTLSTWIKDSPISLKGNGRAWRPQNFDHQSHGDILLYQGLAHSYNQASARLGLQVGVPNVLNTLYRLGVLRKWPNLPAMLLGAGQLTPLEVAGMYQTIAAGGAYKPLRAIRGVLTAEGEPLKDYPLEVRQTLDAKAVFLLQAAMQRVLREGTGHSVYRTLPSSLVVAGKTGTSNDSRDAWFAGFGRDQLAVVWMGRDDNGTTPFTGATGPLGVWTRYMARTHPLSLDVRPPKGVRFVSVDPHSGKQAPAGCPSALWFPYILGSEPPGGGVCAAQPAAAD